MKRAIERSKLDRETNIELVETMWKQFSNLGIYELNVIDTTTHSIKDTVSAVQEKIASKRTTLVEESELTHVAAPDNPTKEFENRQERFALSCTISTLLCGASSQADTSGQFVPR